MRFSLSLSSTITIVLAVIPLALPLGALELLLAGRAKAVREANTQVMLLTLLPTVPGIALMLTQLSPALVAVPVLGQELVIVEALRGGGMPIAQQVLAAGSAFAVGIALTLAAIAQQRRTRSGAPKPG
jgi:sodium transport system permease protein